MKSLLIAQFFTEYRVPKCHRCWKTLLDTFQSTGRPSKLFDAVCCHSWYVTAALLPPTTLIIWDSCSWIQLSSPNFDKMNFFVYGKRGEPVETEGEAKQCEFLTFYSNYFLTHWNRIQLIQTHQRKKKK